MKYVFYIILIFISVSCDKKFQDSSKVIVIPLKEEPEAIHADSIFKTVEYIPLETSQESLLGNINKCIRNNGNFYLMDKDQKVILVFDEKGKFNRKLDRQGRASGEYLYLSDFFIHDSLLYVLSGINKKILVYNLEFKYIKDIKIDNNATNMVWADNHIYIFNNYAADDLMNFRVIDPYTGKTLNKFSPFKKKQQGTSYQNSTFSVFGNRVYAFLPDSYFIYKLGVDFWENICYVDFGKGHRLPENFEDYTEEERRAFKEQFEASPWKLPIFGIDDLYLSEQLLYFSFTNGFFSQHFFCWEKCNKKHIGYIIGSKQFPFANNQIIYISDEYCITVGNISQLYNLLEKGFSIPTTLKDVQIDDNPFLCIFLWNN